MKCKGFSFQAGLCATIAAITQYARRGRFPFLSQAKYIDHGFVSQVNSFFHKLDISIYSELAQEEKRILSERIKSGLVNARHKGQLIGRPEGKQEDEVILKKYTRLAADLRKGLSLSKCQKIHAVSRNTAIKVKRLLPTIKKKTCTSP